jgi:dTDP-4-amino-4,6-dideoxygalactose transaminase
MIVPFLNVAKQNAQVSHWIAAAMEAVAKRNTLILGPEVEAFEREWAAYCGKQYCIGVASCTDALMLLARCYSLAGEVVGVPSNTYIGTCLGLIAGGAHVGLSEGDGSDLGQHPQAFVNVHLYGYESRQFNSEAKKHGVPLIVDAAQAHGLTELGDAAAFSFYPTKNLGALGDAGAVVTDDQVLADKVRVFRNYGKTADNVHTMRGVNSRLDELQAAILRQKLKVLPRFNALRKRNAAIYNEMLSGCEAVALPPDDRPNVWHQYVIQHDARDLLQSRLQDRGVGTMVHYPTPPHLQPCFAAVGMGVGRFPQAEAFAKRCLSLPIGPELTEDEVRYAAEQVRECA